MFTLLLLAFLLDTDHYACQDTKNEPKWLACKLHVLQSRSY